MSPSCHYLCLLSCLLLTVVVGSDDSQATFSHGIILFSSGEEREKSSQEMKRRESDVGVSRAFSKPFCLWTTVRERVAEGRENNHVCGGWWRAGRRACHACLDSSAACCQAFSLSLSTSPPNSSFNSVAWQANGVTWAF